MVGEVPSQLYLRSGDFALHCFCLTFSVGITFTRWWIIWIIWWWLNWQAGHHTALAFSITSGLARTRPGDLARCISWSVMCHGRQVPLSSFIRGSYVKSMPRQGISWKPWKAKTAYWNITKLCPEIAPILSNLQGYTISSNYQSWKALSEALVMAVVTRGA